MDITEWLDDELFETYMKNEACKLIAKTAKLPLNQVVAQYAHDLVLQEKVSEIAKKMIIKMYMEVKQSTLH